MIASLPFREMSLIDQWNGFSVLQEIHTLFIQMWRRWASFEASVKRAQLHCTTEFFTEHFYCSTTSHCMQQTLQHEPLFEVKEEGLVQNKSHSLSNEYEELTYIYECQWNSRRYKAFPTARRINVWTENVLTVNSTEYIDLSKGFALCLADSLTTLVGL